MPNFMIDDNKNLVQSSGIVKKQIGFNVNAIIDSQNNRKLNFSGEINITELLFSLLTNTTMLVTVRGSLFGDNHSFKSFPISLSGSNLNISGNLNIIYNGTAPVHGVVNFIIMLNMIQGYLTMDVQTGDSIFTSEDEGNKTIVFDVYQMT